jgi:hypothetical protein
MCSTALSGEFSLGKSSKRFEWSTEFLSLSLSLSLREHVPSLPPRPSPFYFQAHYGHKLLDSNPKQFNRTGISLTHENNDVMFTILLSPFNEGKEVSYRSLFLCVSPSSTSERVDHFH